MSGGLSFKSSLLVLTGEKNQPLREKIFPLVSVPLVLILGFLYAYDECYFKSVAIPVQIALLVLRVLHFIAIDWYYYLIDYCQWINYLVIYNYFYPGNLFWEYFGAFHSLDMISLIVFLRIYLKFNDMKAFISFSMHFLPVLFHLPMIQSSKFDFSDMSPLEFHIKNFLVITAFHIIYYCIMFKLCYSHWKKNNLRNLFVLTAGKYPFSYLQRGKSDQVAGVITLTIYFIANYACLITWVILLPYPFLINYLALIAVLVAILRAPSTKTSK